MGGSQQSSSFIDDGFGYTVRVGHDIRIPETDDLPTEALKERGARNVGLIIDVLATVELDEELQLAASQVDDVACDRQLPGESRPKVRHANPDQALGIGRIVAELACSFSHEWRHARHL